MMQPTMKLRIVLRKVPSELGEGFCKRERVHQQWWEGTRLKNEYQGKSFIRYEPEDGIPSIYETYGEWRDIPIEVEE